MKDKIFWIELHPEHALFSGFIEYQLLQPLSTAVILILSAVDPIYHTTLLRRIRDPDGF